MRRILLAATLIAGVGFGSATGSAASLTVLSNPFWSGNPPITACDRDGVSASYNTTLLLTVSSVTVSGITDGSSTQGAGACDGRTVRVVLVNSAGTPIGGASGARLHGGDTNTSNDSVTVSISSPPLTLSVAGARITIGA